MNVFDEQEKLLTVGDLYLLIEKLIDGKPEVANLPVLLVENIQRRGKMEQTVRHLEVDDINIEKDLPLACNNLYSLFDKGVVIGFLSKIEE